MRFVRLALALLLFAVPVSAQRSDAAAYPIAGTIVAETSGQPLQRATVQILNTASGKQVQSTTSDEYGHFAFPTVPAGNYILQGTAPGYLLTNYDDHDGYTTGIILPTSVDTQSLVLKLHPQGILTGTILDENAEPVRQANVRLFHQTHDFGDDRIVSASTTNTDDLGHFEIPRLAPGTYLLAVTATPWYAVHPMPPPQPQPRGFVQPYGFVDSIDPSLDVAYPTTYYPGTTDSSQATPILVRGGPVDISLRLAPEPALTLTLPFTPPKPGQPGQPMPQIRTSIFGQLQPVFQQEYRQNQNQITIAGLPAGDYVLSGSNQAAITTTVHLTDHSTGADLPLNPNLVHVHVLLKTDDGAAIPPNMLVFLFKQSNSEQVLRVNSAKGEAKLDVPPGDYYFSLCTGQRHCFIRQILANDKPVANNLHLTTGSDPTFTILFNIGTHTLKGVAQKDGKPGPGVFLLAFPTNELPQVRTFFRNQSDLDGSFDFKGLAPGDYTVVAIDNGWDLDWSREAVLSSYLAKAVSAQIPATAAETATLPTPVPVQPK